jgi:hypothetical protein
MYLAVYALSGARWSKLTVERLYNKTVPSTGGQNHTVENAEILHDYERHGDAMRYLNAEGQIAWKASPAMLRRLADAEREVEDDMEDLP